MHIDSPTDQIRELAKDPEFDVLGAALQVGGLATPVLKVVSVITSILSSRARGEKVLIAIRAVCDELDRVDSQRRKELEEFIESDWFKRALVELVEEAARAPHEDHARLLARFAAHGCLPDKSNAHRQEDLASYIRDLARLGTDDIQMLKLIKSENLEPIRKAPHLNMPDMFSGGFDQFRRTIGQINIDADDVVALGARLSGFGLAYETPRNTTKQSPQEHFFRPTKRGLYLLSLLEAAELPIEEHN